MINLYYDCFYIPENSNFFLQMSLGKINRTWIWFQDKYLYKYFISKLVIALFMNRKMKAYLMKTMIFKYHEIFLIKKIN